MNRRTFCGAALSASVLALAGCAPTPQQAAVRTDLIEANYQAVDVLLAGVQLATNEPLLVATLVSLDSLNESSRLGRLFSEQISSRITAHGYAVEELKLRESLFIQAEGAMLLSREVRELTQAHRAQAVVVGTYATSRNMLYVSLKIVVPNGNVVVAAHDYAMPIDTNIRDLLMVRGLGYGSYGGSGKLIR
jgi:TolB-like protein